MLYIVFAGAMAMLQAIPPCRVALSCERRTLPHGDISKLVVAGLSLGTSARLAETGSGRLDIASDLPPIVSQGEKFGE